MTEQQAQGFYAVHKERPFYKDLVAFMTSGPVVVVALEGENAIATWRGLMGPTNSEEADPGTIRGDFGVSNSFNLIHGSDSPEAAARELELFFDSGDIVDWTPASQSWVYDLSSGSPE